MQKYVTVVYFISEVKIKKFHPLQNKRTQNKLTLRDFEISKSPIRYSGNSGYLGFDFIRYFAKKLCL